MLVLGYHHPLEIAKRYGTLDRVSGGRLVLGVGVGSLEDEFVLLGAEFDGRGPMGDDAMRALRAALSQTEPEYDGEYFTFGGFVVDPAAVQAHVPIWVGGRTGRSLRRAVELGDGWAPFGLSTAELGAALDRARDTDAWAARTDPLDVIVQNDRPLDPSAEPDRVAEQLAKYESIGATALAARFVHHSVGALLRAAGRARRAGGVGQSAPVAAATKPGSSALQPLVFASRYASPSAPRRSHPVWTMSSRVRPSPTSTKVSSTSVASPASRPMCHR